MFAQGQSVDIDYIEAYGWIYQSANAKDPQAIKNLDQLRKILGSRISKAETRAEEISNMIKQEK